MAIAANVVIKSNVLTYFAVLWRHRAFTAVNLPNIMEKKEVRSNSVPALHLERLS